jgi:hypothetical protein
MAFFREVQAADCANQFYTAAYSFAINGADALDLSGQCEPSILDSKQIKARQALMDSLTLYVDKIQALAASDDNKTLDSNSTKLAGQLKGLAVTHALMSGSMAQDVEAAVIGVAEMALDQKKFTDIKNAATAMAPNISKIVEALKTENKGFAEGIASKTGQIEGQLKLALVSARKKDGPRSLLDVIAARDIVRSVNPLGATLPAVAAADPDPKADPRNVAKQLNAALDALVNSNDALAGAGTGGLAAAVNDLVARGQHLNTILSNIKK